MDINPYAKYLAGQDPLLVLASTAPALHALTEDLSTQHIELPSAPGKWNIREILAHLADCELVFCFRLRQTLAEHHATLQPFDQGVWAERYAAYDFASAMALFQSARNWNLKLLATVTAADRQRPVTHPERGTMTFWTIIETIAGHDLNHLQQIEKIVAAIR